MKGRSLDKLLKEAEKMLRDSKKWRKTHKPHPSELRALRKFRKLK